MEITCCGSYFLLKTNIHLEQHLYLFKKIWKYGGSVFGTEVVRVAQTE